MWSALERHRHLGDAAAQPLAGAQVERDAGPAPVADVEAEGRIGLRPGRGVDVLLVQVAADLLAALPAGGVLAAGGVQVEVVRGTCGGQHLLLLDPQAARVERQRLLHRHQRHQLQQVVLDHVTRGSDAVVVAGPPADADVLGHGDLDVIDVVAVPHRLEHRVAETEGEDVLDGLLAEVVVDAEHRLRREHVGHHVVEHTGTGQVVAERLLHHHPAPGSAAAGCQPVLLELADDGREELRRDREVEREVPAGSADLVELLDRVA